MTLNHWIIFLKERRTFLKFVWIEWMKLEFNTRRVLRVLEDERVADAYLVSDVVPRVDPDKPFVMVLELNWFGIDLDHHIVKGDFKRLLCIVIHFEEAHTCAPLHVAGSKNKCVIESNVS